jgi:hypothetical protein
MVDYPWGFWAINKENSNASFNIGEWFGYEQNFSAQGFVHNQRRNRLGHVQLRNSMSIRTNSKAFSHQELVQLANFEEALGYGGIADEELVNFNADMEIAAAMTTLYDSTATSSTGHADEDDDDDDDDQWIYKR